ncbi:hydroxyacylglutathione hydrolase [Nevskia ramosa]|uniref:hydroxyacylglutathione hydrolase n=1 Tax=Nevskia ramosa TaxID=64002 RepID=UPI0003B67ECA
MKTMAPMITVTALPAFTDNYLWLLERDGHAAIVDPGDASVVSQALASRGLVLDAILITHHHPDHIGGLAALAAETGAVVYGPRAESAKIKGLTVLLDDGDQVSLRSLGVSLNVLAVPGHTLGHIAYFEPTQRLLFCGDTLFIGGCGRLFEGTPAQMQHSLARLADLPGDTAVYCAHEYTLSNYDFIATVEPDNASVAHEFTRLQALRAAGRATVPGTIAGERARNPFLRSSAPELAAAMTARTGQAMADSVEVFAALRRLKDGHVPRIR